MSTVGPGLSSANILPVNAKRERRRRNDVDIFDFRDSDLSAYEERERGHYCSLPGSPDLGQREVVGTLAMGPDYEDLHVSRLLLPADFSYPPPFARTPMSRSDQALFSSPLHCPADAPRSARMALQMTLSQSVPMSRETGQKFKRNVKEAHLRNRDVRSLKKRLLNDWVLSQSHDKSQAPNLISATPPSSASKESHEQLPRRRDPESEKLFDEANCKGNDRAANAQEEAGMLAHPVQVSLSSLAHPRDGLVSSPYSTKQVFIYNSHQSCVPRTPHVDKDAPVVAARIMDIPLVGNGSELGPDEVKCTLLSHFRVGESPPDAESYAVVFAGGDCKAASTPTGPCARADLVSGLSAQSAYPSVVSLVTGGTSSTRKCSSEDKPLCEVLTCDGVPFGALEKCKNLSAEASQVVSDKALESPKSRAGSAQASPTGISVPSERKRSQIERRYNLVRQFEIQKISGGAQQKEHVKMNLRGRTKLELWLAHAPPETLRAIELVGSVLKLDKSITSKLDTARRSALHAMRNEDLRACEALMIRIATRDGKANWRLLFKLQDELMLPA
jgi:hypothetical protein